MDSVIDFTEDYEVVDPESLGYITPSYGEYGGEIVIDDSIGLSIEDSGDFEEESIQEEQNNIIVTDDIVFSENEELVSIDPIEIKEQEIIPEEVQEEDYTDILVSLSTIRDAIKLGNTNETEVSSEISEVLSDIETEIRYTNYLLAMVIGILVIKALFEKVGA